MAPRNVARGGDGLVMPLREPRGAPHSARTRLVDVVGLGKEYAVANGRIVRAVADVSFGVAGGEFVSVVGPSGAGKTTVMMCIAGLIRATEGEVRLRGVRVTSPQPGLAVVFQDYSRSLFPWLSVSRNVSLGLEGRGLRPAEIRERTRQGLEAVGLSGFEHLYPWQLSGGMQQRVAIARGLALSPELLLMDEPFGSVDAQTRANLEDLVLDVWTEFGMTILFVTHDIDEAVYLSDRVIVLSEAPSVIRADIPIELPRPRDQIATKQDPLFGQLRAEIFGLVMSARQRAGAVERGGTR